MVGLSFACLTAWGNSAINNCNLAITLPLLIATGVATKFTSPSASLPMSCKRPLYSPAFAPLPVQIKVSFFCAIPSSIVAITFSVNAGSSWPFWTSRAPQSSRKSFKHRLRWTCNFFNSRMRSVILIVPVGVKSQVAFANDTSSVMRFTTAL